MALHGCCYKTLKYMVLIFNFLFWLLGLAVLVVALWLYIDTSTFIQVSAKSGDFNKGVFVFMAIGVLMLVVGFLGCCGALKESQCMLCCFFVFLMIIVVAEISVVVLAVQNKDTLVKDFKESMAKFVKSEYTGNPLELSTNAMDEIQRQFECCGAYDFNDWRYSKLNGNEQRVNLGPISGVGAFVRSFRVPESCCRVGISEESCREATNIDPGSSVLNTITNALSVPTSIYTEGCTDKMLVVLEHHRDYFIAMGLFIVVIELIGMIVSTVLCCAIRRLDDMKV